MFDNNDFSVDAMDAISVTYSEEDYLSAKNESFLQGKEEGIKETRQQQEEKIGQLLQKALQQADFLVQAENRREVEKMIQASKLTLSIIQKLLPKIAEELSIKDIENVIIETIKEKKDEPRIDIKVNDQNLDLLKTRIEEEIKKNNYTNQVIVSADASIPVTDCKISWADGGAERIFEELIGQIESALNNSISGLQIKKTNN